MKLIDKEIPDAITTMERKRIATEYDALRI